MEIRHDVDDWHVSSCMDEVSTDHAWLRLGQSFRYETVALRLIPTFCGVLGNCVAQPHYAECITPADIVV